jgi:hypothetical protein
MKNLLRSMICLLAVGTLTAGLALAEEATFTRDLTVNGKVELSVTTGAGYIHLTNGPAGHIHIFGRVRSNWGGSDAKVREIAGNPPIEQTGSIVRIGADHENLHNIGIDYEIQAPADVQLHASSGSGDLVDNGVGANAKLETGSGSIHATGLQGGFALETGSGNIDAEQVGTGDMKVETGSGSIELKNLHGSLRARTGSGSIKAGGTPSDSWRLEAGSGDIEIWTGSAAFTLYAETSSGGIHCDRTIEAEGAIEHNHLTGKVGGGGPVVRIESGSGSIHIH